MRMKATSSINSVPFLGILVAHKPLVDAPPVDLHARSNSMPIEGIVGNLSLAVVGSTKTLQEKVSPRFVSEILASTDLFILPDAIDNCVDESSVHVRVNGSLPIRVPDLLLVLSYFKRCAVLQLLDFV